jgi:hypothetical protein
MEACVAGFYGGDLMTVGGGGGLCCGEDDDGVDG